MKMYQAEVLEKVPVVQHFYFGHILPWGADDGRSGLSQAAGEVKQRSTGTEAQPVTGFVGTAAPWSKQASPPAAAAWQPTTMMPLARPMHNTHRTAAPSAASSISPLGSISRTSISLGRNTAQPLRDPMKE